MLDGLQGMVVFGLVVMCTQLPARVHVNRLSPEVLLIPLAWLTTTWLVNRARTGLAWHEEEREPPPRAVQEEHRKRERQQRKTSTGKAIAIFSLSALAILFAGYALEESGNAIANHLGLNGVVFGATILALATGLPEFTAANRAARGGSFELAVSGVLGSNSFLPVLFLPAALITGTAALPGAGPANVYLTGLGIVLTSVYLWGFFFRPTRQLWRLGPDSIIVLVLYLAGIGGLILITNG
jgi:cation:H+ antiporter